MYGVHEMTLPVIPLKSVDAVTVESVRQDTDKLYEYLHVLERTFPNAVGEAIDPSLGQGGDGAFEITEAPGDIVYSPGSGLSIDGTLFGHIDISFTIPPRAVGVLVYYREGTTDNFKVSYAPSSPYRLPNLKVGVTYQIQLVGQSANNTAGIVFSPLTDLIIPTDILSAGAPVGLTATATYQSIVLTWSEAEGGALSEFQVQRADDVAFATNVTEWFVDATRFVDDTGLINALRHYRVRAVDKANQFSGYSNSVSATTLNVPDASIATQQLAVPLTASVAVTLTGTNVADETLAQDITIIHNLNMRVLVSPSLETIANETPTARFTGVFCTTNDLNSFTVRVVGHFALSLVTLTATLVVHYR